MRLISAVYHNNLMAIYLFDHWKFLRIRPSEIEFQSDFSKHAFNSYPIAGELDLRLNSGVISAVFLCESNFGSLSQYNYLLNIFLIAVSG